MARRARQLRARQLASPPTSPSPSEAVAALSQRVVPQLVGPIQLEEECRLAPRRLVEEHGGTGIVAALDTAASYSASSVCDCAIRRRRARSRDMQAEKEAAADVGEVMRLRGCGRGDGQHVPARRHHRGKVEHGRPPSIVSHEGHRQGDAGENSRCLARFFFSRMLEEDKEIGRRPFRLGILILPGWL